MASPEKNGTKRSEQLVSRTYRAAVRLGEDFITLEETITLPIDASDEEVAQAVDLGWRIYRAQRAAVDNQVSSVRETLGAHAPIVVRDPDAPASEKQRNYIAALQDDLSWSSEQLATYAYEQQVDLVTMSKGQASTFIDGLKKLAEERPAYSDAANKPAAGTNGTPARPADGALVNEKQLHALERLAQQHGLTLSAETRRRFGVEAGELTAAEASGLLREWQRPQNSRKPANEPAL